MTQKTLIIIPARLQATRLPNKPLADIHGKPMIVHVWEKATAAQVGPVVIAAGDQEIQDVLSSFGIESVLTDPDLPSGTDRVKAALDLYDPGKTYTHIINVQGDLPALDPDLVAHVLEPFQNPTVAISTLANLLEDPNELTDPNTVKVALSLRAPASIGRALYFSRSPLPFGEGPFYHHIGIYAYTREALERFVSLPIDPLEKQEKLEQLRALAAGMRMDVKVVKTTTLFGVDTLADLDKARRLMQQA